MLGGIIGDVAGSYYEVLEIEYWKKEKKPRPYDERIKILDQTIPLFTEKSSVTDDSILTCSIYDAICNHTEDYEFYLKKWGIREKSRGLDLYGRNRFGKGFLSWLEGKSTGESFGNGSAMRVSPIGYSFSSLEEVKRQARLSSIPSHNHVEAIKGAEAVAVLIFLLRNGMEKDKAITYIKEKYYSLDFDLEELQHNYIFSSKAEKTVPQAIYVFSIANGFEDAIRKAISIGGDSDTIACITGAIAGAYYEIPKKQIKQLIPYLTEDMKFLLQNVLLDWEKQEKQKQKKKEGRE